MFGTDNELLPFCCSEDCPPQFDGTDLCSVSVKKRSVLLKSALPVVHSVQLVIEKHLTPLPYLYCYFSYKVEGGVTGIGLFQLVPAKEGPFLLLAEVGSLLQEPVGDPALTDPCRGDEGMGGEGRREE